MRIRKWSKATIAAHSYINQRIQTCMFVCIPIPFVFSLTNSCRRKPRICLLFLLFPSLASLFLSVVHPKKVYGLFWLDWWFVYCYTTLLFTTLPAPLYISSFFLYLAILPKKFFSSFIFHSKGKYITRKKHMRFFFTKDNKKK